MLGVRDVKGEATDASCSDSDIPACATFKAWKLILLQHSQTRKTQQLICQPRNYPLLHDPFCEQQPLFTPWMCSAWKVPPVGCGWGITSRRRMGMTAWESPPPIEPKVIHHQLQKTRLPLPPLSALTCNHTLCRQSRFSACFPQENPRDLLLRQVSASLPGWHCSHWHKDVQSHGVN